MQCVRSTSLPWEAGKASKIPMRSLETLETFRLNTHEWRNDFGAALQCRSIQNKTRWKNNMARFTVFPFHLITWNVMWFQYMKSQNMSYLLLWRMIFVMMLFEATTSLCEHLHWECVSPLTILSAVLKSGLIQFISRPWAFQELIYQKYKRTFKSCAPDLEFPLTITKLCCFHMQYPVKGTKIIKIVCQSMYNWIPQNNNLVDISPADVTNIIKHLGVHFLMNNSMFLCATTSLSDTCKSMRS